MQRVHSCFILPLFSFPAYANPSGHPPAVLFICFSKSCLKNTLVLLSFISVLRSCVGGEIRMGFRGYRRGNSSDRGDQYKPATYSITVEGFTVPKPPQTDPLSHGGPCTTIPKAGIIAQEAEDGRWWTKGRIAWYWGHRAGQCWSLRRAIPLACIHPLP